MAFLPHAPIILSQIRVNDIWFLLAVGAVWEIFCRVFVLMAKIKPQWLLQKEDELQALTATTAAKRKLGPQAFVETSKLERQVLALEKELAGTHDGRKKQGDAVEKQLLRYGNMQVAFLIFFLYYGVPVLTVEMGHALATDVDGVPEFETAGRFLRRLLFPLSTVGMGVRMARWGMHHTEADASIGALVVFWAGQVTAGKIMDAVDAYFLHA